MWIVRWLICAYIPFVIDWLFEQGVKQIFRKATTQVQN